MNGLPTALAKELKDAHCCFSRDFEVCVSFTGPDLWTTGQLRYLFHWEFRGELERRVIAFSFSLLDCSFSVFEASFFTKEKRRSANKVTHNTFSEYGSSLRSRSHCVGSARLAQPWHATRLSSNFGRALLSKLLHGHSQGVQIHYGKCSESLACK